MVKSNTVGYLLTLPLLVQQPFDPSYYAQFYRSGAESDGRLSPFPSPGVATKYNGNLAVLSPSSSQSPQEVCTDKTPSLSFLLREKFLVSC